jgi:hypothetical protein
LPRQRLHLRGERFQRLLPPLLRDKFKRRVTSIVWQRKHFSEERSVLAWRKTLRQQGV